MNPYVSNPVPSQNPNSKRTLLITLAVLAVVVVLNIFTYLRKNAVEQEMTVVIDEKQTALAELNEQYIQAQSQLDSIQRENPAVADRIETLQQELEEKRNAIAENIRLKGDLAAARREITGLLTIKDEYLGQISALKGQVNQLSTDNRRLTSEKIQLEETLVQTSVQLEQEKAAQAALLEEKERVAREQLALQKSLEARAFLTVADIRAHAQMLNRNKTKSRETKSAKAADRIQICFRVQPNSLVPPGEEQFLVRIVGPDGATLFLESQGSGTARDKTSDTEFRYSLPAAYAYQGSGDGEACCAWEQDGQTFAKGDYTVAVFHRGRQAGSGRFTLR